MIAVLPIYLALTNAYDLGSKSTNRNNTNPVEKKHVRGVFWQRILTGKQPFRMRIAYYPSFVFDHSSEYHKNLEGKSNIFRKMPTFLFSPNGQKSVKYLKSSKLEGLRISAAEVFDTFSLSSMQNKIDKITFWG